MTINLTKEEMVKILEMVWVNQEGAESKEWELLLSLEAKLTQALKEREEQDEM